METNNNTSSYPQATEVDILFLLDLKKKEENPIEPLWYPPSDPNHNCD